MKCFCGRDFLLFYCPDCEIYRVCSLKGINETYTRGYLLRYERLEKTKKSEEIQKRRWKLVKKYLKRGTILDFGCGCRTFSKYAPKSFKVYNFDLYFFRDFAFLGKKFDALCFWDTLEHCFFPDVVIKEINPKFIFVTIPLVRRTSLRNWKHLKPKEHIWYFTSYGLKKFFEILGYKVVEKIDLETDLRSPDVKTWVARKNTE